MTNLREVFGQEAFDRGLPKDFYFKILKFFTDNPIFESDKSLREFIKECPKLEPWKNGVPEAGSVRERVQLFIDFLYHKKHVQYGNALLIFLEYLAEKKNADLSILLPQDKTSGAK